MKTLHTVAELREQVAKWHRDGLRVAFVPTMGNLHEGHLALVDAAFRHADRVLVSIFVNPLQFGQGEDFDTYPRTLEDDRRALEARGASLLFAPSVVEMYPRPQTEQTRVEVPGISDILCGASRPGHFVGVATVVCKLLNMAQADVAVFGEKDYQQLMVIRLMVQEMEDTLVEIRASCADAMANRKRVECTREEAHTRSSQWEQRAKLAIEREREDLAREALLEKRCYNERVQKLEKMVRELKGNQKRR